MRHERLSLELPDGMVVAPIADGETLQDLLLAGEIDALLAPKPPQAFLDGDPRLRRIIPDFGAAERGVSRAHRVFPIMHLIAVRKTLVAEHPWLPEALMQGFTTARDMAHGAARGRLAGLGQPPDAALAERRHGNDPGRMGPDYWPYGYAANLKEIETRSAVIPPSNTCRAPRFARGTVPSVQDTSA